MSPVTVFVRLTLLLGLLTCHRYQAEAAHAAGPLAPNSRPNDTNERVCRSFKVCHNSRGAAWTTVQVFSAAEPLLTKLRLEPATDFIEVTPLAGCVAPGCCCNSPVDVRISLPVHKDAATAAAELASVAEFLQLRLPRELQGTACTSNMLEHCPPLANVARKNTRTTPPHTKQTDDVTLPPLPAGLIPYDGKKPAPELEDDPQAPAKPQTPTKPQSPAKPRQQRRQKPQSARADDPALDPPLPPGLIPYDHKTSRQLLEEADLSAEEAAIAAVPALSTQMRSLSPDYQLASGTPGSYGDAGSSSGRSLLESVGGYGSRSLLQSVGRYGSSSGRSLLEQQPAAIQDAKPAAASPEAKKPEQRSPPKQAQAPKAVPTAAATKDSKQPPAPCSSSAKDQPGHSSSSSSSPSGKPLGSCYCRYNRNTASWALEQAACRAALFSRCKTAGPLLQCSAVKAFYKGLGMPGSEPPEKEALEAYLYSDCPPAPPCSCHPLVSGNETPTAHSRCCADLRAHCQVPFSGLDCEDVSRFCKPGRQSTDPVGALFSYVLVKTHGVDCSSPQFAVSYSSVVPDTRPGPSAAVHQLSKAAWVDGVSHYDYSEPDRVAALLTMLVGGCFAVVVAAVGLAVIFRAVSVRQHHIAPLLERA